MTSFDQEMNAHQIQWRRANITTTDQGWQNGQQREWIIPSYLWEQVLWPAIRSGTPCSLPDYLTKYEVQKHQGVHNLKSSWAMCANVYFPFGQSQNGRDLLAGFLRDHVDPRITSVDTVELEYAETGDLHPSKLLGEPGGVRGSGQTSPDVAFLVNNRSGLILTENKLVEHSFYPCSGRRRISSEGRPGNPDPKRCLDVKAVLENHTNLCHQVAWGRRYWELLAPVIRRDKLASLHRCPAATHGYQLFRQQALAEGIAESGKYQMVFSCLAVDHRNTTLRDCLQSTGIQDIRQWGGLFAGKAGFAVFCHQDWVAWVRAHDQQGQWRDWLGYVEQRYGFAA